MDEKVRIEGYSTDLITDEAINWLEQKMDKKSPFMLMVHFKAVHVARMPALRNLNRYVNDTIPEPATLFDDFSNRESYAANANMLIWKSNLFPPYGTYDLSERKYNRLARMTEEQRKAYHAFYDPQNKEYEQMKKDGVIKTEKDEKKYFYQRFIKDYIRTVEGIDENVGRLSLWLEDNNLSENTIVIYCSDQGYFTGEHGWAEKRLMYEDALKMPLIIRWPAKIKPGLKVKSFVQNIDYAPTFLDAAGIDMPEDMQGVSLLPLFDEKPPRKWRNSIYYHYYDHGRHGVPRHEGVRTNRYKLINYYTDDAWELFDLENDPHELYNVYNDPVYQDVVEKLKNEILDYREKYEVPDSTFTEPYIPLFN